MGAFASYRLSRKLLRGRGSSQALFRPPRPVASGRSAWLGRRLPPSVRQQPGWTGPNHGMPLGGFGAGCFAVPPMARSNLGISFGGEHWLELPGLPVALFENGRTTSRGPTALGHRPAA